MSETTDSAPELGNGYYVDLVTGLADDIEACYDQNQDYREKVYAPDFSEDELSDNIYAHIVCSRDWKEHYKAAFGSGVMAGGIQQASSGHPLSGFGLMTMGAAIVTNANYSYSRKEPQLKAPRSMREIDKLKYSSIREGLDVFSAGSEGKYVVAFDHPGLTGLEAEESFWSRAKALLG